MESTTVMVYFSLFGDEFPIDDITKKLGIVPTKTFKKGDLIPNRTKKLVRKETSWDIGTGYQVSSDANNQMHQVVSKLKDKAAIINEIKDTYSVECKFFIVIKIENGNTPALYLDKEVIHFASSIGAEIDIDLYANNHEELIQ